MKKIITLIILVYISCFVYAQEKETFWWGTSYTGFTNAHYGIKIGKMGPKIGLYAGCRMGRSTNVLDRYEDEPIIGPGGGIYYNYIGKYEEHKLAYAVILGMTNNLYTNGDHRFVLQTGLGLGRWHDDITNREEDGGLELELGLQYHYKRFIIQAAINHVDNYWSLREIDGTIGFGLRF